MLQMKSRCPVEQWPAQSHRCHSVQLLCLCGFVSRACLVLFNVTDQGAQRLAPAFVHTPCPAARQCSVPVCTCAAVSLLGVAVAVTSQPGARSSLCDTALHPAVFTTLCLGTEEPSLQGIISISRAEELELELLWVLLPGSGGYSGCKCGVDPGAFILNYCSHARASLVPASVSAAG